MPTEQKIEIVNKLTQKLKDSPGIYFTKYTGMDVSSVTYLRRQFRDSNVDYFVTKNTLTRLAAKNAGFGDKLDSILKGQIGVAYALEDPTAPARVIRNYEKENKESAIEVIGLLFEGELFDADKYRELADLPGRDELLSKFVGGLNQPMSKLVNTLNGAMSKFAMVLSSLKETK